MMTSNSHAPRLNYQRWIFAIGVVLFVWGAVILLVNASDRLGDLIGNGVIGAVMLAVGCTMIIRVNPYSKRWSRLAPPTLGWSDEGVIVHGNTVDTTVPWHEFGHLVADHRGQTVETWLITATGHNLPVLGLAQTKLGDPGSVARWMAYVADCDARLHVEQARQLKLVS